MLTRLAGAGLLLLAACGGSPGPSGSATATLFLVPDSTRAVVDRPFRLHLMAGDLGAPRPVADLATAFDPFVARVGGTQHNALEPDVVAGALGVTHRFEDAGDAMVGCSTVPHRVVVQGRTVLLTQHAKALLFVSRTGLDLPRPSAALSARIGLRLEIVPMLDPLPLVSSDDLPLRVRFDGPGLAGAEVVVQHTAGVGGVGELFRGATDAVGSVVVRIGPPGRYLVTVAHTPAPDVLHRASLTFDVGAKR